MFILSAQSGTSRLRWFGEPLVKVKWDLAILQDSFAAASADRDALSAWRSRRVARRALVPWVDGPLAARWGALAAGRVHHIAMTGFDGAPQDRFEHVRRAHARALGDPLVRVPGAPERSQTFFDVIQALSWVASSRANFQERLAWRAQIPALVQDLVAAA